MAIVRTRSGTTIIELLVAMGLISFVLVMLSQMLALNSLASAKLTGKLDGQMACSLAMKRICSDIRQARVIGNVLNNSDTFGAGPPSSIPPVGGFPTAPWPAIPYKLGPQTLIIQRPVFLSNGFPTKDASGVRECLDTIIYQIVSDPLVAGQYSLQVARFPGTPASPNVNSALPINPPQTILKGIIGPTVGSTPTIFQFIYGPTTTYQTVVAPIVGVSINLEVQTPSTGTAVSREVCPLHCLAYVKNSRFLRLIND